MLKTLTSTENSIVSRHAKIATKILKEKNRESAALAAGISARATQAAAEATWAAKKISDIYIATSNSANENLAGGGFWNGGETVDGRRHDGRRYHG